MLNQREGEHSNFGNMQVKNECDIAHEVEGDLKSPDDHTDIKEREYDTVQETERDFGESGDSKGTLECMVGVECSSPESQSNSGNLKVSQVRQLRRRSINPPTQVRYGNFSADHRTTPTGMKLMSGHHASPARGLKVLSADYANALTGLKLVSIDQVSAPMRSKLLSADHASEPTGSKLVSADQTSAPTGSKLVNADQASALMASKLMSGDHGSALTGWKFINGDVRSAPTGSKLQMDDQVRGGSAAKVEASDSKRSSSSSTATIVGDGRKAGDKLPLSHGQAGSFLEGADMHTGTAREARLSKFRTV